METTGEKRGKKWKDIMEKKRRKDVETKKPCPQRCLCRKVMYADTRKGGEDKERGESVKREEISLEMQCLSLLFLGFIVFFFYIITDFSGISVFSSN